MKEMLRSFRIFTAQYSIKVLLQAVLIMLGIFTLMCVVSFISFDGSDFLRGFVEGFLPAFSMVMPVCGCFLLNAIYSYNMQINPGYKYMHSIKNGSKRYLQAIIVGNILSIIILAVSLVFVGALSLITECALTPMYGAMLGLFVLGIINLTGNAKNQWVRIFSIMPLFIITGFLTGFSAAAEEDGEPLPDIVLWICLAASAAVFVAGIIYTLKTSEKKWRRDEK